jgi:hypothetical protein
MNRVYYIVCECSAWSGLVWSGLVWSGLVWSGLVWSGLVWSGLVWSGLVLTNGIFTTDSDLSTHYTLYYLYAVYTAEHDVNPNIPDYFTALYFGLTTLTTVGFGDIVPVSWQGRLVVSGSILAGVAVIPAQAAVLVEALLARQEERQAAASSQAQAAYVDKGEGNLLLQQIDKAVLGSYAGGANATTTSVSDRDSNGNDNLTEDSTKSNAATTAASPATFADPVRQEVAAQAAKRRHTMVHGSNSDTNNDDGNNNDKLQSGRMVLETQVACPSCGVSMHWSSAKFCWSCGNRMVE